jgi:hypothetical protein
LKIGVQTSGGKSKPRSDRSLRKGLEKFSNANRDFYQLLTINQKIIMAKKRKASSAGASREDVVDDSNKRTKMRIKTYEDVAGSDDEFHINRDKVMLDDGPEAKRRRRVQEEGKDQYTYAQEQQESNLRKQRNSCNSPTRKF